MEHQKITFFFTVFFMHQMVPQFMLFFLMILLHTPNRALVRAFLSFSSCTKSCFFLVFFVHQIVLFCGFLRAPNGALLRATVTEVRQGTNPIYGWQENHDISPFCTNGVWKKPGGGLVACFSREVLMTRATERDARLGQKGTATRGWFVVGWTHRTWDMTWLLSWE